MVALPGSVADRYPRVIENLLKMEPSQVSGFIHLHDKLLVDNPNLTVREAVSELEKFGEAYTIAIRKAVFKGADKSAALDILKTYKIESSFVTNLRYFTVAHGRNATPRDTVLAPDIANSIVMEGGNPQRILSIFSQANFGFWTELIMALHTPDVVMHSIDTFGIKSVLHITDFPTKLAKMDNDNKSLRKVEFDLITERWQTTSGEAKGLTVVEIKSLIKTLRPASSRKEKKALESWIWQLSRQKKVMAYLGIDAHQVLWTLGDIGAEARAFLKTRMPDLEIISK